MNQNVNATAVDAVTTTAILTDRTVITVPTLHTEAGTCMVMAKEVDMGMVTGTEVVTMVILKAVTMVLILNRTMPVKLTMGTVMDPEADPEADTAMGTGTEVDTTDTEADTEADIITDLWMMMMMNLSPVRLLVEANQ